jgi:hypothetical protein
VSGRLLAVSLLILVVGALAAFAPVVPAPLSGVLAYLGLGLLPGLALGNVCGRFSLGARVTLGLALSPLLACAIAVPLLGAGVELRTAAMWITGLGAIAAALTEWLRARTATLPPDTLRGTPDGRYVAWWCLGIALAVAFPPLVNRYVAVRGDAWTHAGLVWEIIHRGLPPEDPRFAGQPLHYVWFFHLFLALLVRLSGDGPFFFMPLFNVVQGVITCSLAYRLGFAVWRERPAARAALTLVVLGFNAGAYLLWPLELVRELVGETRGVKQVLRVLHTIHFPAAEIIHVLRAGYASMVNFLDKLLTGTAVHHGYVLMMVYLWASLLWLSDRRFGSLVLALAAAAGMLFFHGVVGLSVVPIALATIALAAVLRPRAPWLPSLGRLAWLGGATGVGALLAVPYTLSISRGWAHDQSGLVHSYVGLSPWPIWTIITACGVAAWLAYWPSRRALRERLVPPAFMLAFAACAFVFASLVKLPGANETKFVFEVFVPLAVLGAAAFPGVLMGWRARFGPIGGAALFTILFLVNPIVTLVGFAFDPAGHTLPALHPRPGEERLERWIRNETPKDAVLVDANYRDLLMVKAERRVYLGSHEGPEKAAFPLGEIEQRRRLVHDLYEDGAHWAEHREELRELGRPIYVLFRPEDAPGREPWRPLARDPAMTLVYEHDGYRLYELRPAATADRKTSSIRSSTTGSP